MRDIEYYASYTKMTETQYMGMDKYDRLILIYGICEEVRKGLESIIDKYMAHDYIAKLLDTLAALVPLFLQDTDFNNKESIDSTLRDITDIIPLVKNNQADFSYIIRMLICIEEEAEKRLPDNLRNARFWDSLIDYKEEICTLCGFDEESYLNMITKMREKSDSISDIIKHPKKSNDEQRTGR